MESPPLGVHNDQPAGSSASLPLPGSVHNPIDLTSPTPFTPPGAPPNYINLTSSPLDSVSSGPSALGPSSPALYLEGLSRTRSNTQGRYRQPSSNTFTARYQPGSVPSTSFSRPHSLSTPSPMAASSPSGLPPSTRPLTVTSNHTRTSIRSGSQLPGSYGGHRRWESSGWVESGAHRPPRTFNELLPASPFGSAYHIDGTGSSRRAAWQPDDDVTACTRCSRDFGLLVRRHHCR